MTALTYRYCALTDVGLRRTNNQDSGYASPRMLVLADGMGGAAAGDLASAITMEALREIDRDLDPEADGTVLDALTEAVSIANHRLGEVIRDNPLVEGMGTTLDAMYWDGEKLGVAHIGDSRIYRFRGGKLTQISVDHTYVQSLIDEGRLTPAEARVHPHRSLLLRAILGRDDLEPDFTWLQPAAGDRYLLCSDGLSDMVQDEVIERSLRLETIDLSATELVRAALEGGGLDNVTVVLAEFVALSEPLEESLSCADGRPQVVGSAAENPQPRTGLVSSESNEALEPRPPSTPVDPEELRYAPRPAPRFRWIRITASVLAIVLGTAAATAFAYDWSQKQYFVADYDGTVAIYRGVDANLPGLSLNSVEQTTRIDLDTLPTYSRQQVEGGITATSLDDAKRIVDNLSSQVREPAPTPRPTPELTTVPTSPASPEPGDS
ncbi:MAG: serine/threonine-protein phosphatase [Actinomycetales bacterium]|nr:serine/threonine-protein phosphatase [Actinomycetales bacterium]